MYYHVWNRHVGAALVAARTGQGQALPLQTEPETQLQTLDRMRLELRQCACSRQLQTAPIHRHRRSSCGAPPAHAAQDRWEACAFAARAPSADDVRAPAENDTRPIVVNAPLC